MSLPPWPRLFSPGDKGHRQADPHPNISVQTSSLYPTSIVCPTCIRAKHPRGSALLTLPWTVEGPVPGLVIERDSRSTLRPSCRGLVEAAEQMLEKSVSLFSYCQS